MATRRCGRVGARRPYANASAGRAASLSGIVPPWRGTMPDREAGPGVACQFAKRGHVELAP